ncbi:MAG: hypothetical protein PHW04_06575 [Candidatus Wallbacteria bacterium]|nr:hypothetical protein [Candidatus Wallbacteria bacterium]
MTWKCQCGAENVDTEKCSGCGKYYEALNKSDEIVKPLPLPIAGAFFAGCWSWILMAIGTGLLNPHNPQLLWFDPLTILICPLMGYCAGKLMERNLLRGSDQCIGIGAAAGLAVGFFTGTSIFPVLFEANGAAFSLIAGTGPGVILGMIIGAFSGNILRKKYAFLSPRKSSKPSHRDKIEGEQ